MVNISLGRIYVYSGVYKTTTPPLSTISAYQTDYKFSAPAVYVCMYVVADRSFPFIRCGVGTGRNPLAMQKKHHHPN